jgi:hypothetical protein|tara:strand:- start:3459 stop:3743 length:285 start_codon:yes stop_codon:yes gene_type:complete
METPSEIIPDEQVKKVHANANFGDETPRQTLNEAVLAYAFGFGSGHTAMIILREHGLIGKPKGYTANLTAKGKRYARAITRDNFNEICALLARG